MWEADTANIGLAQCTGRSRPACAPTYLGARTARQIAYAWAALSKACHYHAYEIAPTATRLSGWFQAVEDSLVHISHQPDERNYLNRHGRCRDLFAVARRYWLPAPVRYSRTPSSPGQSSDSSGG